MKNYVRFLFFAIALCASPVEGNARVNYECKAYCLYTARPIPLSPIRMIHAAIPVLGIGGDRSDAYMDLQLHCRSGLLAKTYINSGAFGFHFVPATQHNSCERVPNEERYPRWRRGDANPGREGVVPTTLEVPQPEHKPESGKRGA